ncbi:MAG: hypothetical protein WEB06_00090 [Actinomycetota bacterium]
MPQQGARPAVGDQGGRGALLTPVGRLTLAGAGVIVGGMVVAAGTRMTWVDVSLSGAPVNAPGLPPIFLGGGEVPFNGAEIGAGYLFGLGLLLALVPLGWLVTGPKGRLGLGALGLALGVGIGIGVSVARSDSIARASRLIREDVGNELPAFRVKSDTGPGVTAGGAALAGLSSVAGAIAGRRVPKLRMADPPDKGAAE